MWAAPLVLTPPLFSNDAWSYVAEGQYVRAGDKLFEITNLAKLWFMFRAFEQDLQLLEAGQIVASQAHEDLHLVLRGRTAQGVAVAVREHIIVQTSTRRVGA